MAKSRRTYASFWLLIYLTIILVVVYGYFANGAIFLLVTKQGLFNQKEELRNALIDLEARYLVLSSRVNLETAQAMGFRDVTRETIFVNAGAEPLSLVLNNSLLP